MAGADSAGEVPAASLLLVQSSHSWSQRKGQADGDVIQKQLGRTRTKKTGRMGAIATVCVKPWLACQCHPPPCRAASIPVCLGGGGRTLLTQMSLQRGFTV